MARTTATDSRERIAEAALNSFADKGFHGTTTRDIAAGAGMSPAALYVHHTSKEDLLFELSRSGHLRTLEMLTTAAARSASPTQRLREIVRVFVSDHAEHHVSARVVNYELGSLSSEHRTEVEGLRTRINDVVRVVIAQGVDAGEFDVADIRVTTGAVLSLGLDVARWYRSDGNLTPEYLSEQYAEMALRIVGAKI